MSRLAQARDFLEVADVALAGEKFDPAASDAVLAGIAAADAICCAVLHRRSSDGDHLTSKDLVDEVDPKAGTQLGRLLSIKSRAQYDSRSVTSTDATNAVRRAARLVEMAEQQLAR